ncbi:MAG: C39 family peptidase [Dethiobacteria bacterium]
MYRRTRKHSVFKNLQRAEAERRHREEAKRRIIIAVFAVVLFFSFVTVLYIELEPTRNSRTRELAAQEIEFLEEEEKILKPISIIDAPLILQLPELPRGCEVTSLAMLLNHAGIPVDKMTLAREIKKDDTVYRVEGGKVYFGNPYEGFVGNMYDRSYPGLAVYHEPICELAEKYLPGRVVDLTGTEFEDILYPISEGRPVWVIVNSEYDELDEKHFKVWKTPSGSVKITYKTHAVLLTGYDDDYIYFNDPLVNQKNRKVERPAFERCWVQMGRQAITYE